ncbi:MAG TPA: WGR domain-containing protein [Kofleriaceae bacterium]|jgi:predicted DNA-binding WGR domain protein
MSDWTVHLEFEEGNSSKFWRARVEGKTLYVNYGKIGSNGQTQVKDFASPDVATREYDKLVTEKRKKGYQDAGGGGGGGGGDDDEADDQSDDEGGDDDEDEAPAPKKPAVAVAAPKPSGGTRLTLDAGNRKVETIVSLDGTKVRMDSTETYSSPDAAKKAFERLKKMLGGEGFKE